MNNNTLLVEKIILCAEIMLTIDALVSYVTDIGLAIKGEGVVFTKCKKVSLSAKYSAHKLHS
jgi:hypothetical protein